MDTIRRKIRKAQAAPKDIENGVLAFAQHVLLPASALKSGTPNFRVSRERDGLEPLVYTSIEQMQEDYKNDVVCSPLIELIYADSFSCHRKS